MSFDSCPDDPLVATYSIVARDAATGQIGVAVQSCHFGVGSVVPWAEAGVGAVATQSFTNVAFGPEGLALLRAGIPASDAIEKLLETDPGRAARQVGLVDATGRAAAYTGSGCIPAAGHSIADGVSVQANMMTDGGVWPAMLSAYGGSAGDLAARLLAALQAAEAAGGDIRGRQSAALIVVSGERANKPWQGRVFDLRVEDHPEPVVELARLVRLQRAVSAHAGFLSSMREGTVDRAFTFLQHALQLAPELDEVKLSAAIGLYFQRRGADAQRALSEIFTRRPGLAIWLDRMAAAGMLPADPGFLQAVNAARSSSGASR
ncbi:MAG TPA: DUF1028 domain-containing protein [Vicinamibacterales bacterium]|jgi:uncharacterized Ntn-hydrolase superfamily protein|nr:DUF1028 domain-containing protein [Vicinamibacterales bacterium]